MTESKLRRLWSWGGSNPLWDLIKFVAGSTLMTSLWIVLKDSFHHHPIDWGMFSCWLLAAVLLLTFALRRDQRLARCRDSRFIESPSTDGEEELPVISSTPRSVDLRGQISEMLFHHENNELGMPSHVYVFLKAQIVNHGPVEATITHVGLNITVGQFETNAELVHRNLDGWRIQRRDDRFYNLSYRTEEFENWLGTEPASETYRTAIPREGWLAFEVYDLRNIEFPNAKFKLILQDSLGNTHQVSKEPALYVKSARVINAHMNSDTRTDGFLKEVR